MYQLKELFEQKTSNVIREISPNYSMYVTEEHYFSVGHSALKCIKLAMLAAGFAAEFARIDISFRGRTWQD